MPTFINLKLTGSVLLATAAMLSACEAEREAEAETPVAEAEVSTELPESVVSDPALQATANAAAEVASTPPPRVVVVPGQVPGNSAPPASGVGNVQSNNQ